MSHSLLTVIDTYYSLIQKSHFPKVMRSFGWNPKDEEVKDMVNVIDQVR